MSIRYVAAVLDALPDLSASETLVLIALADYTSDDTLECWPSMKTICRRARCDRRTAQRTLRRLEVLELIQIAPGGNYGGMNKASSYRLRFDHQGKRLDLAGTYPQGERHNAAPGAAATTGGGGVAPPRGAAQDRPIRYIDPSLNLRGDKSRVKKKNPADRLRDAYNATDAELEEKASTGRLSAEEEHERERRRKQKPRTDAVPRQASGLL